MAFSLITSVSKVSSDSNGFTTSSVDTTGANLLVASVSWLSIGTTPTLSDSKGNSWTGLTAQSSSGPEIRLFYSQPTSVGSGHTFTLTGNGSYSGLAVSAWSGALASSPFDVQNGNHAESSSPLATGSVTPSVINSLVIAAGTSNSTSGSYTIDSSFTVAQTLPGVGGNSEGICICYLIETSISSVNPTITMASGGTLAAVAIATFKPSLSTNNGRMFLVF